MEELLRMEAAGEVRHLGKNDKLVTLRREIN